jgi:orotate phosphoribosyltransferase
MPTILPAEQLESLVLLLYEIGAVQIGNFTLHSGRQSPIYIDLRILASFPRALRRAASAYRTILESLDFDLLAATPLAGLPIGTAISLDMNLPLIYPRQTAKGHGTKKQVEGKWLAGQTAVLIDDLITSGDSLLQTFTILASEGISASKAVVLIDRNQGGREFLEDQGFLLYSVMNIGQLLAILEGQGHISSQQREHILGALL